MSDEYWEAVLDSLARDPATQCRLAEEYWCCLQQEVVKHRNLNIITVCLVLQHRIAAHTIPISVAINFNAVMTQRTLCVGIIDAVSIDNTDLLFGPDGGVGVLSELYDFIGTCSVLFARENVARRLMTKAPRMMTMTTYVSSSFWLFARHTECMTTAQKLVDEKLGGVTRERRIAFASEILRDWTSRSSENTTELVFNRHKQMFQSNLHLFNQVCASVKSRARAR